MRTHLAKQTGRLISKVSRALKLGGGSAAPGLYALKIDPNLVTNLASAIPQNIIITGTNGKTTTSRMIAHFLQESDHTVIRNSTGSNLERGIASALIHGGDLKKYEVGVWELDEAAFNSVVFKIKPQLIIFLNAFRDQLDRYGEVDTVVRKWSESLEKIDWQPTILVNSADMNTWGLRHVKELNPKLTFHQFRVKNHVLQYEKSLKGNEKKKNAFNDDFLAEIVKDKGLSGSEIKVNTPDDKLILNFPIPGIYHIYDFLAAFGAVYLLNINLNNIQKQLNNFSPAFGRVERITLQPRGLQAKKEGFIFLIKNPAGASAVFETVAPELKPTDTLLLALNDNFADGLDVSWIWDGDFEKLALSSLRGATATKQSQPREEIATSPSDSRNDVSLIVSGTRAYDMAIRLKYAGFETSQIRVEPSLKKALEQAVEVKNGRMFILPTYTALLKLQDILTKQGVKQPYWADEV